MRKPLPLLLASLAFEITVLSPVQAADPLALQRNNPSYVTFRGKATILVGSGEHYGAVVNPAFDTRRYLDTLAEEGLNLTRLFVGTCYEKPGDFGIGANTLAPAPGRALARGRTATSRARPRGSEARPVALGPGLLRAPAGVRSASCRRTRAADGPGLDLWSPLERPERPVLRLVDDAIAGAETRAWVRAGAARERGRVRQLRPGLAPMQAHHGPATAGSRSRPPFKCDTHFAHIPVCCGGT